MSTTAGRDVEIVKSAFARDCQISEFEELLNNRLLIEQLGGLIWALERITALTKGELHHLDFESRLKWYATVADRSAQAVECALC